MNSAVTTTPSHDEMIAAVQDMISALEYERDHLPDFDATRLWLWRGILAQLEASRWHSIDDPNIPRHGNYARVWIEEGVLFCPNDGQATHYLMLPSPPATSSEGSKT